MAHAFGVSVIISSNKRLGTPLNNENSTILGSTKTMRSSSGVYLYIRLTSNVFKNTLLPVPVAPATKRCGILERSKFTGLPTKSLPKQNVSDDFFAFLNEGSVTKSFNPTVAGVVFGTSIPIREVPVMGAKILIVPGAAIRKLKSF